MSRQWLDGQYKFYAEAVIISKASVYREQSRAEQLEFSNHGFFVC